MGIEISSSDGERLATLAVEIDVSISNTGKVVITGPARAEVQLKDPLTLAQEAAETVDRS